MEAKEGVIVNPRDEQKKMVLELARRIAAQRVGENLDSITDKIDNKFAKLAAKKSEAEADVAELELAMEGAEGIVREALKAAYDEALATVEECEELLNNSRGDVLSAYVSKLVDVFLGEIIRTLSAARKENKRDLLENPAYEIARSIRRTEKFGDDIDSTFKRLN